jgi:SPP1 gp7 family putative phage head morphogenesis protein
VVNLFKRLFKRGGSGSAENFADTPANIGIDRQMLEELALFSARRGLFGITGILNYNPDDLVGRKGLRTYTEMYQRDDMVRNASNMKVLARLSSGWDIKPADEKLEPRAEEQADFCRYLIEQMHGEFYESLRQILTAHRYGFSVTEIMAILYDFGPFSGKIGLRTLKTRNPVDFDFDVDKHGNIKTQAEHGVDGLVQGKWSIGRRKLPLWKFVLFTYMGDFGNHYGQSDYRPCYRNFRSKDAVIRFWNIALERYGMPTVYATILAEANMGEDEEENPTGLSKATKDRIVQALKNLTAGTTAYFPKGVDINKVEEMRGRAAYNESLQFHDRAIARAILMPSLITEEGKRGSMALGKAHVDTFRMVLEHMGKNLEDVLNEQLFRRLLDLNWADIQAYPKFEFRPLSQDHLIDFGERAKLMAEVGILRESDEDWLRENFEMPPKPEEESAKVKPKKAKEPEPDPDDGNLSDPGQTVDFDASTPTGQALVSQYLTRHVVPYLAGQSLPGDWPRDEGLMGYVKALEATTAPGSALNFQDGKATAMTASQKDLNVKTLPRERSSFDRVDYKGIQKFWRDLSKETVARLVKVMEKVKSDTMKKTRRILTEGAVSKIDALVLSPAGFNEFRKVMQEFYTLDFVEGAKNAADEVNKGLKKNKQPTIDFEDEFWSFQDLVPQDALDFMKTKSPILRRQLAVYNRRAFTVTGVEKERILKEVQLTMQTGVARGHSVTDIMGQIDAIFNKYTITGEIVAGELTRASRIETIVRTNLSEAFNSGRLGAFNDAAVAPFVEAYEYTAIIDPRTTDFCESYDGYTRPRNDPKWTEIWPPNHFNCRSMVVAAVSGDTWERTAKTPSEEPQDGFKL